MKKSKKNIGWANAPQVLDLRVRPDRPPADGSAFGPRGSLSITNFHKIFIIAKNKKIKNKLKNFWEVFLSTYQYSKKKIYFEYFSASTFLSSGDIKRKQDYQHISFQGSKEKRDGWNREKIFSSNTDSILDHKKRFYFAAARLKVRSTPKVQKFFSLTEEKFGSYNYLILAKIVDLIGYTQDVQDSFRQIIKIHTKHFELEKVFQIKVFKNSLLLYWISYLLIEQIYHFIRMINLFLYQSKLISPFGPVWGKNNKLDIQNNGNFLFLKCKDFFMLKWYQKKIQAWFYQVIYKNKKTRSHQDSNKILSTSHISGIHKTSVYTTICFPQNADANAPPISFSNVRGEATEGIRFANVRSEAIVGVGKTNSANQNFLKKECFDKKINNLPKVPNVGKQRYLRLIKNLLQKSKVTTQLKLIQKLNEIIGNWDTFVLNNINKRKSRKLNQILYQFLWGWGFARHRKQKAKWIQNRYWSL